MNRRPAAVVFDVNETLSDLRPLRDRFADLGLSPEAVDAWFAGTLRDGIALSAAGTSAPFAQIAGHAVRAMLPSGTAPNDAEAAEKHVLEGFMELDVHPDVVKGVRALDALGIELTTLSNGAAAVAESLLVRSGIRDLFTQVLTVEDVGVWKPSARVYGLAVERTGHDASDLLLISVHPWDVDGAQRAGLRGAWLNRTGAPRAAHFLDPSVVASSLPDLATQLGDLPG